MAEKTYFYVFVEDPWDRDRLVKEVFELFSKLHKDDMEVRIFHPGDDKFEDVRRLFEIRKLPAFAIADEPYSSTGSANPFVSFERGVLELYNTEEELYRLISDIHYMLKDENILRVSRKLTETRISAFFKKVWEEVKDVISIRVP